MSKNKYQCRLTFYTPRCVYRINIARKRLLCTYLKNYRTPLKLLERVSVRIYEGWNFNSGNYLFTTDTK